MKLFRSLFPLILLISATVSCFSQPAVLSPQDVDLSFKQSRNKGNCFEVAITKWAIATYGLKPTTGPLAVKPNDDGSESITLADGTVVTVTPGQEQAARTYSEFDPQPEKIDGRPTVAMRNQVVASASRLYAVMALRARGKATDGRTISTEAFQTMLSDLAGVIDDMYGYLGFQISDSDSFPKRVENTFGSATHVVFVLNTRGSDVEHYKGNMYDEHGGELEVSHYDYPLKKGHLWRYALADGAPGGSTVMRQCEDKQVWKACSYAR